MSAMGVLGVEAGTFALTSRSQQGLMGKRRKDVMRGAVIALSIHPRRLHAAFSPSIDLSSGPGSDRACLHCGFRSLDHGGWISRVGVGG